MNYYVIVVIYNGVAVVTVEMSGEGFEWGRFLVLFGSLLYRYI